VKSSEVETPAAAPFDQDALRRAECLATLQSDAVQLALDLLVRSPDVDGFFGALIKAVVQECESRGCAVWLLSDNEEHVQPWMAYVEDRLLTAKSPEWDTLALPRIAMADHLFAMKPGWSDTIEYRGDDERLPEPVRTFHKDLGIESLAITPMVLGDRTLGWMALSTGPSSYCESQWRVELLRAMARQATLALYHHRMAERGRREERRKAILEERNRLARDIHDTLAQGFAAILMQLQAAQREAGTLSPRVRTKLETAIELARSHVVEARRSVSALRPQVGGSEDLNAALTRLATLAQRTSEIPIDVVVDELPRYGDVIERELVGIAQEALTNAIRHSSADRITLRASSPRSIGLRLSVEDNGRGIARDRRLAGFGMTSMQERAERIGASLTIVTAPRSGTEVVVAWEPTAASADSYGIS
jgi:signal transduction histidine kinase